LPIWQNLFVFSKEFDIMARGRPRETKSISGVVSATKAKTVKNSVSKELRRAVTPEDKELFDTLKKQEEYLKIKRENAAQAGRLVFKDVMINQMIEILKNYDKGVVKMLDYMPNKLLDLNKTKIREVLSEEIERSRKEYLEKLSVMKSELKALRQAGNGDLFDVMGEADE
jgi:hypothetical protein